MSLEWLDEDAGLRLRAVELAVDAGAKPGAVAHAADEILNFIQSCPRQSKAEAREQHEGTPRKFSECTDDPSPCLAPAS
jgi:hypothetical protein